MFKIKEVILEEEQQLLISFLSKNNLEYEYDIDFSILVYDNDQLIATGSLANNIMKCFLVIEKYKGKNVTNLIFKYLVDILYSRNVHHFFVFTLPRNEKIFLSLNMKRVVKTMNTVLLESGEHISDVLTRLKINYDISNNKKACLIINANPMTLGHQYLIETAAKENKEVIVFVVSEDLSSFPFSDRFKIIKEATKHLDNVKVLPSLSYLVSRITFPKYFLKEDQLIQDEQTLVDVLVYKEYYAKIFKINLRYLGEEPFSYNTSKYNKVLQDYLGQNVKIVKRLEHNKKAISASQVRKLMKADKIEKLKDLVPQATYDFLLSDKGKEIIKKVQSKKLGRH